MNKKQIRSLALRVDKILQEDFGWETGEVSYKCTAGCIPASLRPVKYCSQCGARAKKSANQAGAREIEAALTEALKTSGP